MINSHWRRKWQPIPVFLPEELWMEVPNTTGGNDQNQPQEKEMQKGKMVV